MFNKDTMRKLVLYLVATIFIAYGAGTAMLMSSTKGKLSSITLGKSVSIDQEKQESLASVKEISVEVSSAKVNVIPENRKDVKAHLTGNITSPSLTTEPTLETTIVGNKLNIKVKTQNNYFGHTSISLKLDVYVPVDYSDDLRIKSSSGDININDLKLNNLTCNLSSGKLNLSKLTVNDFVFGVSSGSLIASDLHTKSSELEASSGKILIDRFTGDLKAQASSGDIKIKYSEFNNNADVTVSSGRIELTLPEDSEFKLSAKASSGDITCEFPITVTEKQKDNLLEGVVKSDNNEITLKSSSGDIKVLK